MNIGELENFREEAFLTAAKELVRSDDVLLALDVLSTHLPAYYRQFPPKEITELRNEILKRIALPDFYAAEEDKAKFVLGEGMEDLPRHKMVADDVRKINGEGEAPHIVDFGPGECQVALVLQKLGLDFSYEPLFISKSAEKRFFEETKIKRMRTGRRIFLATELIEHLQNPDEIKARMMSACGLAEIVYITTPAYSFDGSDIPMRDKLGHLRAYTPQELVDVVVKMFPEYDWKIAVDRIIHLRLEKRK